MKCCRTLLVLVPFAIGCGATAEVSGKVTCNGRPVVLGTVMMASREGSVPVYGVIRKDGTYTVREVPLGPVMVAVNSPNPNPEGSGSRGDAEKEETEEGDSTQGADAPRSEPKARPRVEGWFPIPAKYNDLLSSEVIFNVQKGENTFDIEMIGEVKLP